MGRGWGRPGHPTGGPARAELLRRSNLALVLGEIAAGGRGARAQLAERTGLTKATVSSLADTLIATGLVVECDPDRGLVGRPGNPLRLASTGPVGLGIEINVDYVSACIVDLAGEVRSFAALPGDNRTVAPGDVLERAARLADSLLASPAMSSRPVAGLHVALPGLVDVDGVLRRAPNLRWLEGLEVAARVGEIISARSARPLGAVGAGNEANLAALAELWFGDSTDLDTFVRVSGEIGVGAGIVIRGALWGGAAGLAGEIGHVLVDAGGPRCTCGARGCLEQVAGQEAVLAAAGIDTARQPSTDPVRALLASAAAGDRATRAALDRAGSALGVALAGVVNVVDLPTVVLGGVYAEVATWLLPALARELADRVVSYSWAPTGVAVSRLGARAAVRGAAGLAIRAVLEDPGSWPSGPSRVRTRRPQARATGTDRSAGPT